MKYPSLIIIGAVLLVAVGVKFGLMLVAPADDNQLANYFCKGKGYDQGYMSTRSMVLCQTYHVEQKIFDLP